MAQCCLFPANPSGIVVIAVFIVTQYRPGAVELKRILGNINAQHVYSHVDLPSKVKVHQTKSSLEDPAGLAAWMGMVHYISTHFVVR